MSANSTHPHVLPPSQTEPHGRFAAMSRRIEAVGKAIQQEAQGLTVAEYSEFLGFVASHVAQLSDDEAFEQDARAGDPEQGNRERHKPQTWYHPD
jgi:hypothetical protein